MQGQKPNAFLIPVVCLALPCPVLPCLAYTCCAFLRLLGFLCLLSVLVCSLYLCLPVVSMPCRVQACLSLSFYSLLLSLVSVCAFEVFCPSVLSGVLCGFSSMAAAVSAGAFLWSLVGRSGRGSVWFCLGLALLLPWVALWSFWCLVACFALVYAVGFGGGAPLVLPGVVGVPSGYGGAWSA